MGRFLKHPARRLGSALAITGLVAVLAATLFPNPAQAGRSAATPLHCLVCGYQGGADVLLNVLLFVPMATGLRLLGWPWGRVVAASALLSFTVEFLQFAVIPGRDPTLSDLLTNTMGAAAGAALAPRLVRILTPGPALARRLYLGAMAAWLGVLAVSASALRPAALSGRLRNICSAPPRAADVFSGTVRSVVLNGALLPCNEYVADSADVRSALSRGDATVDVVVLSGNPAGGRAWIHTIRVEKGYLVVLAQDGRSAILSMPTAGQHLKFYSPILRLSDAFPASSGIPVELHAGTRGRRMWISSVHAGGSREAEVALSPSHGWSALLPWGIRPGPQLRLFTAIWVAGLILPAAYWAAFLRRRRLGLAGVLAVLGLGLGALPRVGGYAPVHWTEWLGGLTGVALGWALSRAAAYLQSRCGSPSTSAYS
jgi:hypothetical protein